MSDEQERQARSWWAYGVLLATFTISLIVARLGRILRPRRRAVTGRLLVTGTFYNRGWFLAHAMPLARSGIREVIFVADHPQPAPEGVGFVCPPRWASRLLSRAGAKLVWMLWTGWRCRPDLCMGYHLFPGGLTALVAGRLLGRAACYQMTGGPVEILGGGAGCENPLLARIGAPSALLERLAVRLAGEFDLVITRGPRARRFLHQRGVRGIVRVITGSVRIPAETPSFHARPIDLIFVGRLAAIKQPEQFVEIVARVAKRFPAVRAVMVGDGPDRRRLDRLARKLGVADRLSLLGQQEAIEGLLLQSRVFVLTSRSEGMSIALLEAMACGVPVVATDVGELGELVVNGSTGWLIPANRVDLFGRRVIELLSDEPQWSRLSAAARAAASGMAGVEAVAHRWRHALEDVQPPDRRAAAGVVGNC